MYQIYILLFDSGHYYIGRSKHYKTRYKQHQRDLIDNNHINIYMQRVYNLFGTPKCILLTYCIDCHSVEKTLIDFNFGKDKCLNLTKNTGGGDGRNCTPPIRYRDVSTRCNIRTKDIPNIAKLIKILSIEKISKYYKVEVSTLYSLCRKQGLICTAARPRQPKKKLKDFKQLGSRLPEFIIQSLKLDKEILADKYGVCVSTIVNWQRIFQIKNNK